jgi:hydrogenase maturation factor
VSELARSCAAPDPGGADPAFHCITCSDEGVPMRVVRIDAARGLALCEDAAGERSSVEIALIEAVTCGDTLLVHAGTALARTEGDTR